MRSLDMVMVMVMVKAMPCTLVEEMEVPLCNIDCARVVKRLVSDRSSSLEDYRSVVVFCEIVYAVGHGGEGLAIVRSTPYSCTS
jgi:hypothetical protein